MKWPVIWKSYTLRVDIDTGEEITKHKAKTYYIKLSTDKHARFTNVSKTQGLIEYTVKYRRKPQLELPFNNEGKD